MYLLIIERRFLWAVYGEDWYWLVSRDDCQTTGVVRSWYVSKEYFFVDQLRLYAEGSASTFLCDPVCSDYVKAFDLQFGFIGQVCFIEADYVRVMFVYEVLE